MPRERPRPFPIPAPLLATALVAVTATPAAANMVLPLTFISVWVSFLSLLPVIAVEAAILFVTLRRLGRAITFGNATALSATANFTSFGAGFIFTVLIDGPLMYVQTLPREGFVNLVLYEIWFPDEMVWPYSDIAIALTLLVFFLLSWRVEARIARWIFNYPRDLALRAMLWANAATYVAILVMFEVISRLTG